MRHSLKSIISGHAGSFALALLVIVVSAAGSTGVALGQQPEASPTPQATQPQDPISQLKLTPEQREQIRLIREQTKEERASVNQRVRQAQIALNEVLESPTATEALIDERARELGQAQAGQLRMRILMEFRIRRVLTSEQLTTLHQLQAQNKAARREAQVENRQNQANQPAGQVRRALQTPKTLQNPKNGVAPAAKGRTNALPKTH